MTGEASLVAVASRDADRARVAGVKHGVPRAHSGYESLVNDPEIDVVINALHNGLHCEWTVRALEAGKHVLCEKPLACSSAEVEKMFAAARANGRWLMEGFMNGSIHRLPRPNASSRPAESTGSCTSAVTGPLVAATGTIRVIGTRRAAARSWTSAATA